MRYLSLREHSRLELARKLARHAEDGDDIETLLNWLEQNNWLSQERYAESLIHRKSARYGASRIVAELQQQGIGGEALKDLKSTLADTETARACAAWRRKFGTVAADPHERNKQMRFLLQRGFSSRASQTALRGEDSPDQD